jgi:DNA-binding response OmpR family regulator
MWLIALTGYGQASDRVTGQEVGFDEHLVKPIDTDELLRLLDEMRQVNGRQPKRLRQQGLRAVSAPIGNGQDTQASTVDSED